MHDEPPLSRRDRRSGDATESAFDELGLSALLGPSEPENAEVLASPPADAPTPAAPDAAHGEPGRGSGSAPGRGAGAAPSSVVDAVVAHPPALPFPAAQQPVSDRSVSDRSAWDRSEREASERPVPERAEPVGPVGVEPARAEPGPLAATDVAAGTYDPPPGVDDAEGGASARADGAAAISDGDEAPDTGSGGGASGGSGGTGRGPGGGGDDGSDRPGRRRPGSGILAWIRNNPRASAIAGIAAGVVVLGGVSFALGAATSPARAVTPPALTASATATPTAKPTVRPAPSPAPAASRIRTCSVASYAADPGFGTLEAQVRNASTGEVLFDRNGSNPAPTASVLKMLTAAAAFSVLGPDYRVPTTVVRGTQPGQVVVIGGGDVTLSRLPSGQQSFYTGAPHLDDLAAQVKQAWNADPSTAGQPITSLVVDTSLYSGPVWQPSWDEREERVVEGSTPYMTSFMVDGDRADPTAVESPRSTDPVGRAAQALADDLGGGISISQGAAPAGAKQLGQVLSQPVSALAEQALTYSDNTIMEELARLVAIKSGAGNSFSAINAGTLKGLASYGIPEDGLYFADGSGLSADNKVPASYLTQFMVKVLNRQGPLGSIYDGLPVAGKTGTLGPGYDRFDGSFSSNAIGHVNAKTGWIDTARTLAGVIHAKDGTDLTFAVYALNYRGDDAALAAIDNLTTAFYECGNNLSNN